VQAFLDGKFTVSLWKAVACDNGRIVVFCIRNSPLFEVCAEPWLTPVVVWSDDGGETWSEPVEVSPYRGRVYDARYRDGVIYVLQFCNDAEISFTGNKEEHKYRLYASRDNGESFEEISVLPIDGMDRGYGSMIFDEKGNLHAYAYNIKAEREMDHVVSTDLGKTWGDPLVSYVAKGIRNPQTALIDGVWILHGRGEKGKGFVFYSSTDGQNWDEGTYLETEKSLCYYSGNIVLKDDDGGNVLLVQYSDAYDRACVNVMHRRLKIRRD